MYELRAATDVSAAQNSREAGGFLQVAATASPGHTIAELERVIVEEIAKLASEGPTDEELERERIQAEAQFIYRLQTVGGFGGKSDQLNAYNMLLKDPGFFARDLARYQSVTRESLQAAVQRYLRNSNRVALSIVPKGKAIFALPGSVPSLVS